MTMIIESLLMIEAHHFRDSRFSNARPMALPPHFIIKIAFALMFFKPMGFAPGGEMHTIAPPLRISAGKTVYGGDTMPACAFHLRIDA